MRRIAGRTNSSNVTAPETGLPGRPDDEDRRSAAGPLGGPERERLAGLDGDAPEVDGADGLDRRLDDVERADRDAARDDEQIGALGETAPQAGQDVVEDVGRDAQVDDVGAGRRRQGPEARPVRVGDPGRPERLAGRPDLVAGRQDRDPRPPMDVDRLDAGARQQGDGRRADRACPARRASCPRRRSLPVARTDPPGRTTSCTSMAAGSGPGRIPAARAGPAVGVQGRRRLDRDHRIGAVGEPRAGGDPDRRPGPDHDVGREARPHLADHLEPGRARPVGGRRRCPRPGSRSRPSPSSARAAARSARRPPRRPRDRAPHRSRPVPCRSAGRPPGPRPAPSRR